MTDTILSITVMAVVTALLRFLPFMIFRGDKKTPDFISYLGKVLPYAIMGMLVVFCLKSVDFRGGVHGLPEIVSILVIVLAHWWKKNTILSILVGTICYVAIVNFI
jgi:branched-subunit amino acid transport protein AzlD